MIATYFQLLLWNVYYLAQKVEVVDFAKASGLVKFQSPRALGL